MPVSIEEGDISPLARLLCGHAGRRAGRHRLIWALDARLADIVRTTTEPLIGQMRLAWWHDVMTDEECVKGRGDPFVGALRAEGVIGGEGRAPLMLLDGWEALLLADPLDEAALIDFGRQRGGGMFHALSGSTGEPVAGLERAGAAWALWDLSGHVGDAPTAGNALALARAEVAEADMLSWPAEWRVPQIAYRLARSDIMAGRRAPGRLTPGLYGRLLRILFLGR